MSIKQQGGVFGRNPTFNNVTIEGQLTFDGDIDINSDLKVDGDLEVTGAVDINGTGLLGTVGDGSFNQSAYLGFQSDRAFFGYDSSQNAIIQSTLNKGIVLEVNNNTYGSGSRALYIKSDTDVEVTSGNLVIGTSGAGIDFSADSSAAGMTSELLDDYEEGTWTPVVAGSSTAGTYELSSSSATYTKIGRQVTLICFMRLAAAITGGGTGALTITGLPFAKTSGPYPIGPVLFDGVDWTAGANLCCTFGTVSVGSTIFFEQTNDNAGASAVQITGVSANDYIFFTISYWA